VKAAFRQFRGRCRSSESGYYLNWRLLSFQQPVAARSADAEDLGDLARSANLSALK
jgi:hypothetical protein